MRFPEWRCVLHNPVWRHTAIVEAPDKPYSEIGHDVVAHAAVRLASYALSGVPGAEERCAAWLDAGGWSLETLDPDPAAARREHEARAARAAGRAAARSSARRDPLERTFDSLEPSGQSHGTNYSTKELVYGAPAQMPSDPSPTSPSGIVAPTIPTHTI